MIVRVTNADKIYLNSIKKFSGSKGIIDDILIRYTNLKFIFIYFECVCKVFKKYSVIFRIDKCEFLKKIVEYVGHNLTLTGNVPEKFKFIMIYD